MLPKNRAEFNFTLMEDERKALSALEKIERNHEGKKSVRHRERIFRTRGRIVQKATLDFNTFESILSQKN